MGSTPTKDEDNGPRGIDIQTAGLEPVSGGWFSALAVGGKIYGVPCNSEQLLVYDPASSSGPVGVDTRRIATGSGKWRAAVAVGGKLIGVPDRADRVLVYDLASSQVAGVDITRVARGWFKWQSAVVLGGKVYGVPYNADKLLVYDPFENNAWGVSVTNIANGIAKWMAGVVVGGRVVCVPCDASSILVYDPAINKTAGVDVGPIAKGKLKWLAAVTVRGKVVAVPCHADSILIYDPLTASATKVDVSHVATGQGKWCGAVVCQGRVFGTPENADKVLVFDILTRVASGIDVSAFASGPSKWGGPVCLGSKFYAMPMKADGILVYDAASGETQCVNTKLVEDGKDKWSGAVVVGGRIYGLPYCARQILVHEPEGVDRSLEEGARKEQDLPEKPGKGLLEDFVAAWLSDWIYYVEDLVRPCEVPKLMIGGQRVEFTVHRVMEEPLQGSPARLASVTAVLPKHGKVLYLVFKGTSFVADFVANASLSPDYAPFARLFGDRNTFVHHGAYHAITQLRVHEWTNLLEQVRQSTAEGAQALVVTGHSLGGQYALAFMLQIFLDRRERLRQPDLPAEEPLVACCRSVSFGSPMALGAAQGSDVREDLAAFMRSRSVLYIHGGDPAPRLWSELDLQDFMGYFTGWMGGQMSSVARTIVDYAAGPGGLVTKIEEMLESPHIAAHLLRPAACYVHLSRIFLLSDEFKPWRPLTRDCIRLEDHHMVEYLEAMASAMDPTLAGRLFAEGGQPLLDPDGRGSISYAQSNLQACGAEAKQLAFEPPRRAPPPQAEPPSGAATPATEPATGGETPATPEAQGEAAGEEPAAPAPSAPPPAALSPVVDAAAVPAPARACGRAGEGPCEGGQQPREAPAEGAAPGAAAGPTSLDFWAERGAEGVGRGPGGASTAGEEEPHRPA